MKDDIFDYEELKVKQITIGEGIVYEYYYEPGRIIEKYNELEDTTFEVTNIFYYTKKGFIDSLKGQTEWFDINEIENIFVRRYCYDNGKILKSCTLSKVFSKWICDETDTLIYINDKNIKEIETYFKVGDTQYDDCGCPIISKPKSHANRVEFVYDSLDNIILSKSPFSVIKEVSYFYDKGKKSKEIKLHGFARDGIVVTKDKLYTEISYFYNSKGLKEKEILKYFKRLESGKEEIIYEFKTNYEYKFYK